MLQKDALRYCQLLAARATLGQKALAGAQTAVCPSPFLFTINRFPGTRHLHGFSATVLFLLLSRRLSSKIRYFP